MDCELDDLYPSFRIGSPLSMILKVLFNAERNYFSTPTWLRPIRSNLRENGITWKDNFSRGREVSPLGVFWSHKCNRRVLDLNCQGYGFLGHYESVFRWKWQIIYHFIITRCDNVHQFCLATLIWLSVSNSFTQILLISFIPYKFNLLTKSCIFAIEFSSVLATFHLFFFFLSLFLFVILSFFLYPLLFSGKTVNT